MGHLLACAFQVGQFGGLQAQGFLGAHLKTAGLPSPVGSLLHLFLVGFFIGQDGLQQLGAPIILQPANSKSP